jgi:hypothetical protein
MLWCTVLRQQGGSQVDDTSDSVAEPSAVEAFPFAHQKKLTPLSPVNVKVVNSRPVFDASALIVPLAFSAASLRALDQPAPSKRLRRESAAYHLPSRAPGAVQRMMAGQTCAAAARI